MQALGWRRMKPNRLLATALLAAAIGFSPWQRGAAQGPSVLTAGLYADAISLDPENTNDNLTYSIEREVYDGLVGISPTLKFVPELATSWDMSPDARTFTFHLRHGVTFQDGTPFNAQAVKLNFDRARDPANKLIRRNLYQNISAIDVVDDSTVRFTLEKPFGAMMYNFSHAASRIISPAAIAQGEQYIARHAVGTGPFRFVSWTPGVEIVLERNPAYWQSGQPKIDRIVFKPVTEDGSRVALLRSGEAQFVFFVPGVLAESLTKSPGISVLARWSDYAFYVALNNQRPPFNNLAVRRALNYAVDKAAIVRVVLRGFGRPLEAPAAPGIVGYTPVQAGGWPYDTAKAKELLAEAGYPNGFTATLLEGTDTETQRVGESIQQMLSAVGVTVRLQPTEVGTLSALWAAPVDRSRTEMSLYGWAPATLDADWGLRPLFAEQSWPPTLFNIGFYKDPDVDALLAAGLSTADQAARNKDYAQVLRRIWDTAPAIFLYNSVSIAGQRTTITGAILQPDGKVDVRWVQFAPR